MREIDSQSKARVVPVAIVAGFGMAGMGLVSDGVVVADTTSVTDTINVTVQTSCTFNSVEDKTYNGSAANGTEVSNFNDSGVHEFNLFCNDNNGYIVTATAYDLGATGIEDVIAYTDNYTHTGVDSMWTAEIDSDTAGVTPTSPVPVGGGTIISSDSNTAAGGASFTATYKAYVGTATPAGTYTGTIEYTLTASGTSSNSGSGSGSGGTGQNNDNNGSGGTDSGNEVTDNANNGGGSGNSGSGSGSGDNGSGDSNGTQNSPQNASPTMLNNTYNTYNTYNTTNTYGGTTNYSGGSTSTPVALNMQGATGGDVSDLSGEVNETTTSSDDDDLGASADYEKPLGVTNTTVSSSNEDSGIDWVPFAVTAGALAVAGVAAIAVSQKDKEKE